MKPFRNILRYSALLILWLGLAGCTLRALPAEAPTPDLTQVYQTVSVRLTEAAATGIVETQTPAPPLVVTATQPAAEFTFTPQQTVFTPTLAPTAICNRAQAGSPLDITIPDDTVLQPGQSFSKTWRLVNAGACTWSRRYAVVWFSGETFGATTMQYFLEPIEPNRTVDITIDMVAPLKPGTYQSNWKLSDDQGNLFGIGPAGNAAFWVRIVVQAAMTPTPTLTPTPPPTPVPYVSGLANLLPADSLDLDTNLINAGDGADILYTLEQDTAHVLTPLSSTRIVAVGRSQPTYADCTAAVLTADAIPLDAVETGTFFCYRTNQGLPGWLRLLILNTQDHTLTVEMLTWAAP